MKLYFHKPERGYKVGDCVCWASRHNAVARLIADGVLSPEKPEKQAKTTKKKEA